MGDDGIKIDAKQCVDRLARMFAHYAKSPDAYSGASIVQLVLGKAGSPSHDEPYALSLLKFLLGYEFPDTLVLIHLASRRMTVHATQKKLDFLREVQALGATQGCVVDLEPREKGEANKPHTERLLGILRSEGGGKVGGFPTDVVTGPTAELWATERASAGIEVVDVSKAMDACLAVKDDAALLQVKRAGHLTARVARNVFVAKMESVIDEGLTNVTHESLSTEVTESLDKLAEYKITVDTETYDMFVRPVVQSGGAYNVHVNRPDCVSSPSPLSYDTIIFSMGARYAQLGACLARTFFVDPSPTQQRVYDALLEAQALLIDKLRPGAVLATVANDVRDHLMASPAMPTDALLTRNFGYGVGLRPNDKACIINTKNNLVVTEGMAFYVCVGLSEVPLTDARADTPQAKLSKYAILIGDTIIVKAGGAEVVTEKMSRERGSISYTIAGGDDDDEAEEEAKPSRSKRSTRGVEIDGGRDERGRSARLAARKADVEADTEAAKRRDEHQAALFERRRKEALKARAGGTDADDGAAAAGEIMAYVSSSEYPKTGGYAAISVDRSHDAVLLPMFGTLVPFHVSTIKSISSSTEGSKTFLRINFHTPGATVPKDCAPAMAHAITQSHTRSAYIRTLAFMCADSRNINTVVTMIKAMQKSVRADREAARLANTLVVQPALIVSKDARVPRMQELHMWPALSSRKTQGTLEAHTNGLRFISNKGERIDVLYSNVAHAIFQPCEDTSIVCLHLHLRNAIMCGKKKQKDVQFYTEVVEASTAIDGRHRSDFDADEYGEEERERRIRTEMNKNFKRFVERVEEIASHVEGRFKFDVPQRDLGFQGTPLREMVTILPCSDCLVSLVDKPPFVVSVNAVEHVHFERVIFNGKSFDMVLIYKRGVREKGEEEFVRVTAIPMKSLEGIKTWLDTVAELTFTEGVGSFAWKSMIEDFVRKDDFYEAENEETGEPKPVGWDFLRASADEEQEEDDGDDDDEYESENGGDAEEDEESDDDDAFDSAVADEEDDDDDDDEDAGDEDADDWDELEKKAEEDDRKRVRDEPDDEPRRRKAGGAAAVKKPRRT